MVLKTVSTLGGGGGGGGGGTPGGDNTQVQFNNSGSFGGSANLTWDGANVQVGSSGLLKFSNGVTTSVGFKAPAIIPANVAWTLPSTDGTAGQFIITNGSGTLSWASANLTPVAPTNYSLPIVSGTTTVGQTLSSTTGGWNGYPSPTYAYQWVRGVSNIGGATSATYPLVDADYNNTIKVIVTATNSAGSANATSAATATVAGTVPGAPTIGTATAGNAQAAVSFTAPAVTGGPSITSYTATSSPSGITGSAASSPIIVSGLTNGTAYTFTVTATNSIGTSAASAASNSVTPIAIVQDASFAYVPLLLETTSTNGQQNNTFLDSSTNNFTITRNGTPTQGSITPYWPNGQWSVYFSGSYLSVADSASLRFGSGNFTIEAWVFRTASGATHTIAAKGASTPTGWVFQISSANKLVFIDTSTSITGTTSLAANIWYYVAVVRSGTGSNQTTLYVNGASDGTGTSATTFSQTDAMRIGTDRSAANGFAGYVSNLRLSNTNLTISSTPTTPLTALGSTIFLSCGYNRFVDGSSLGSAITVGSGTPTVQAFQPFSPAASYSAATYAGSGYFNGSTDYISAARQSAFLLGTNNFTIEFWAYFNSVAVGQTVAGSHITSAAGDWLIYTSSTGNLSYYLSSTGSTWNIANQVAIGAVVTGTWYHVALVRNGSVFTPYLNGVAGTTTTSSASLFASSAPVSIAASNNPSTYFSGYVSNFRMVNGTAIVPPAGGPTTPVTNTAQTSLLLNMANAGIYDAAAQNVMTTVGNAQVGTAQYKWPSSSMFFDGTGDYLKIPASSNIDLGSGNYTIEFWAYSTNTTNAVDATFGYGDFTIMLYHSSSIWTLEVSNNGVSNQVSLTTAYSANTWTYFAITRSANTITLYKNSVSQGTGTITGAINTSGKTLYVGNNSGASQTFTGYIQDFRITKGVARSITANPTAAFPVQ